MPNTPPPSQNFKVVVGGLREPARVLKDRVERVITTFTPLPQAIPADPSSSVDPEMVEILTEICDRLGALDNRIVALERPAPDQRHLQALRGIAAAVDAWRASGKSEDDKSSVAQTLRVIEGILHKP